MYIKWELHPANITSNASAVFNISYPFPNKAVFEWMEDCARFLNENQFEGKKAILDLEEDTWILQILHENDQSSTYYLPDEFQNRLDAMVRNEVDKPNVLEVNNLGFKSAENYEGQWKPNWSITALETNTFSQKKDEVELQFELRRNRYDAIRYTPLQDKPDDWTGLLNAWENNKGFVSDFALSTMRYNRHHPLAEEIVVLPLLAYYGGEAINTRYNGELKLPYKPSEFQAYRNALEPKRFDFKEFLSWALWAQEKEKEAWNRVKETILNVLNGDQKLYEDIRVESQMLVVYKKTDPNPEFAPLPVEVGQLSAGEKNIFALVGDMAKRAVQLNPVLFHLDIDPQQNTLINPFQYTTGIVLIDEIDLHLHPRWQRVIVPKLSEHFPKVQFVITTHSPFVLQGIKPEYISVVKIYNYQLVQFRGAHHFGRKAQDVAYIFQGLSLRLPEIKNAIDNIYEQIEMGILEDAIERTDQLAEFLSEEDDEIINLRTLIEFKKYDEDNQE